ncbi:PLxRFG domain-containing protein [Corticibacter populi]|nr:PLxRFG domain-containing protein [Corticibacter populi]
MSEQNTPKKYFSDEEMGIGASTPSTAPQKRYFSDSEMGIETDGRGITGFARDVAGTALNAAISVPELVVGLADIPTGGRAGKFLEDKAGLRFKEAKQFVNENIKSDQSREAHRKFDEAEGFVGKAKAAIENPSIILEGVGESLGAMGAGGVAARGLMTATRLGQMGAKGAALAGAAGEGVAGAGAAAEQIRQETDDGLLTPVQSSAALGTGALTGVIGAASGRLANRLGIGDVDTMVAQGSPGVRKQFADEAAAVAANPLVQQQAKSISRQVIEGAITEGLLEELPQSVSEQILQNIALDKPWHEDVDAAIVMGTLTGSAMGAGAAGYRGMIDPRRSTSGDESEQPATPQGMGAAAFAAGQPMQPPSDLVSVAQKAQWVRGWQDAAANALQLEDGNSVQPEAPQGPQGLDVGREDMTAGMTSELGAQPTLDGVDMAPREWDTGALRIADDRPLALPPPDSYTVEGDGFTTQVSRKKSEQMGLSPADGSLSAAAATAVDTGASDQVQQQAALAQAVEAAEDARPKGKQEGRKAAPEGVDAATGEVVGDPALVGMSDEQLSAAFQGAQDRSVRLQLAQELSRRRTEREEAALQAELRDELDAPDAPAGLDSGFARVSEDASAVPANINVSHGTQQPQGVPNGPQADQAIQGDPQPAQARAAQAKPEQGLTDGAALTANPGAQAAAPSSASAQAQGEGSEQRAQRLEIAGAAWTRMPAAERQELAKRIDAKPIVQRNLHSATWERLNGAIQQKLADAISPAAKEQPTDMQQFSAESGTLGVPRSVMPQVPTQSHGGLVRHLNAQGIDHETTMVDAASLKPTQAEYSPSKVQEAKTAIGDRAVIVSNDGHIIDGHHQAVAAAEDGRPVKAIVLDAPVAQALQAVKDSPSAQQMTTPEEPTAPAKKKPRGVLAKMAEAKARLASAESQASQTGATTEEEQKLGAAKADTPESAAELREPRSVPERLRARRSRVAEQERATEQAWTEKNLSERERLMKQAGVAGIFALKHAQKRWANIPQAVREKVAPMLQDDATKAFDAARADALETEQEVETNKRRSPEPAEQISMPQSKTPLTDLHVAMMERVRKGEASVEDFKKSFSQVNSQAEAIKSELAAKTKTQLLESIGPYFRARYANEKKATIIDASYREMIGEYALGQSFSYGIARDSYQKAVQRLVDAVDETRLQQFAQERKQALEESKARMAAQVEAIKNPQTLADFRSLMRHYIERGDTRQEAFMRLEPEQRIRYDELDAESTKAAREKAKANARTLGVGTAGQATTGSIVETKHTRDGYDLFVVQLGERVSREDYDTLNASAKRLGGWYSKFRGNGAVPGFQFKARELAQAFSKLVAGDAADAQAVAQARQDAFADDRSQSAVQRLRTMAQALDERAQQALDAPRKANTDRRARMAASAEAAARADKALAGTMNNLAKAIEDGRVKFLDAVRQKVQVELLARELRNAKDAQIRAKYPSYADQLKHQGEPVDAQTVDFADFPSYAAMRSDLASMARQMLEVDGLKKLGARLEKVADDVTEAYTDWAKENLSGISRFGRGDQLAEYASREAAERAIRKSGLVGRAIVLPVKRGQNRIVLAPGEAMKLGIWQGDGDKRISLSAEFGAELVQALGRRAGNKVAVPWALEASHDKRKRLEGMGIMTASEYRSALREFASLQEAMATPDKIKEMERSMIGRRDDGLDFFPTSEAVVDTMLEAAGIEPGMAVLEPSAGMGHIADAIRDKAGIEPDVVELSGERRDLLEAKGYRVVGDDFTALHPREGFTYGDVFRDTDGTLGVMRGSGGLGSERVGFQPLAADGQPDARNARWVDRDDLVGVEKRGTDSGYDRIIMNPPFSKGRDVEHVRHAYDLLRSGGRVVAIIGEGSFFRRSKAADEFRAWLDERGAVVESLPENSFMDPALPVNTAVNARLVVIEKPAGVDGSDDTAFSQSSQAVSDRMRAAAAIARDRLSAQGKRRIELQRQIEQAVQRIGRHLSVPVEVVATVADAREKYGKPGIPANIRGIAVGGKDVTLIAENLHSLAEAEFVLWHELLHIGLSRKVPKYGAAYSNMMHKLAQRNANLAQVAKEWREAFGAEMVQDLTDRGFGRVQALQRMHQLSVEEALADLAGANPNVGWIKQFLAELQRFIRNMGFSNLADWMEGATNAQALQVIAATRGAVVRQGNVSLFPQFGPAFQPSALAYSRESGPDSSIADAGRRAVGRWKASLEAAGKNAQAPEPSMLTPAVLRSMGAKASKLVLPRTYLRAILSKHPDVPEHVFENLPLLLADPLFIIPHKDGGLRVFVEAKTARSEPIAVGVSIDPGGRIHTVTPIHDHPDSTGQHRMARDVVNAKGRIYAKNNEALGKAIASARASAVAAPATFALRRDSISAASVVTREQIVKGIEAGRYGGDVAYSRASLSEIKTKALDQIHLTLSHPGKVSIWDKTVGTMRNLAERTPAFKPVFETAQRFLDDVSMLANDAADFAPRLVPRVDSLRDLAKKPVSSTDNKAVAKPLFEGTLMWGRDEDGSPALVDDLQKKYANLSAQEKGQMMLRAGRIDAGVLRMWQGLPTDRYESLIDSRFQSQVLKAGIVWSDAELKSLFKLNDQQVSLYREARAAIDRSIDVTARADMLRVLGEEFEALRDVVLDAPTLQDAMDLLTSTLHDEAKAREGESDRLMELYHAVVDRATKARELMDAGYAPLSRFGRYTVDVVDGDGERQYFGMYESKREANLAVIQMRQAFPRATIEQGTMSQEAYKLFSGITPESLELFGNMLGLSEEGGDARDKVFQEYLKLTKNNHSALKRLVHRKGIAGYSEDVGRVLSSFIYSNARQAAGGLNAGGMDKAINDIPKEQGELKDVAMGLRNYIRDPQEEGQAVRGMLFAQYLGGSVASAFVNMTQPFAVTMPWLSQYGGMHKAGAQLARALREMAGKGSYETDLANALKRAEEDGVVSPQEIHQLMAQARGTGSLRSGDGTRMGNARAAAANAWERTKVAWGQPFALAEQFNRRSTFIAAYRIAKDQKMADPAEFARQAVLETQFLYSKANKMRWARGAVGGTLMTFKTYSVSYLELMHRMWTQGGPEGKRAVAWAMAMLLLMGGAGGLPFMEDAEDLIDGAGQLMGYNISTKQWRKKALENVLGKEFAEFVDTGFSGIPGAPIDVSGRLGMGNLLPGTGLLLTKQSRERDLMEVVGPAGDLAARFFGASRKMLTGDLGGAALEMSPTAVRNAAKGADMAVSGMYKDTNGYKVIDTTLTEAISKAAGFQPRSVAQVQEANSFMQRSKSFYTQTSSEIRAQWADALFRKDDAALRRVRARLDAWNSNNPEQPIVIRMPDIWKRVREMGKDRTQRIADTSPKALRQQMQEMAREVG